MKLQLLAAIATISLASAPGAYAGETTTIIQQSDNADNADNNLIDENDTTGSVIVEKRQPAVVVERRQPVVIIKKSQPNIVIHDDDGLDDEQ